MRGACFEHVSFFFWHLKLFLTQQAGKCLVSGMSRRAVLSAARKRVDRAFLGLVLCIGRPPFAHGMTGQSRNTSPT